MDVPFANRGASRGAFFLHQQYCFDGGSEIGFTYPAYLISKPHYQFNMYQVRGLG